jgi:hypothetical protein
VVLGRLARWVSWLVPSLTWLNLPAAVQEFAESENTINKIISQLQPIHHRYCQVPLHQGVRDVVYLGWPPKAPCGVQPMSTVHRSPNKLLRSNSIFNLCDAYCVSVADPAGSGSTCFWDSWIRIHQSEVWIRIRSRILLSPSKNSVKNIDSYCFVTSFWLNIFENNVNKWTFQK